jgi:hypothetical protein
MAAKKPAGKKWIPPWAKPEAKKPAPKKKK